MRLGLPLFVFGIGLSLPTTLLNSHKFSKYSGKITIIISQMRFQLNIYNYLKNYRL